MDESESALFHQDLDEVHLLLAHISGRTDKSFDGLAMKLPNENGDWVDMSTAQVLLEITRLRYPPPKSEPDRSRGALILLAAKDRLTALASPARGLTVAYTTLFVAGRGRRATASLFNDGESGARVQLAARTISDYITHVNDFHNRFTILLWITPIILLIVAMTYWDVAHGHMIQLRIEQTALALSNAETKFEADTKGSVAGVCYQPGSSLAGCSPLQNIVKQKAAADADAKTYVTRPWTHCFFDPSLLCASVVYWNAAGQSTGVISSGFLGSLLNLFNGFVLPVLFATLGTLVRTFRVIREKIGDCTLAPRDRMQMLISLPLGLVAGLAVGLFYAPKVDPTAVAAAMLPIALTTSGIGFLAGYGADAFFSMLDTVLKRVFSLDSTNGSQDTRKTLPPT